MRFQELDDLLNSPAPAKSKLTAPVAGYRLRAGMTCQRGESIFHDWQEPKTEMEPVVCFLYENKHPDGSGLEILNAFLLI